MKTLANSVWLAALSLALTSQWVVAADIFDAVRAGDGEKVKALLQADPKLVESRTEDGNTPLHLAALEGHAAVAQVLLDQHAPVNARGLREETPLHMAMYEGHHDMAEVLLANRADANAPSVSGETPLHVAARKGHRELVELLLSHSAEVNARDHQDQTPLHLAAAAGHAEVVKALMDHDADAQARDKSGRTPKAVAVEKGHADIIELLTLRVGTLGDVRRFVVEGAKTFTAERLLRGLQRSADFFEVSHPLALQDAFLEAVEKKLQLGYQHAGFPEAQITVRAIPKAGEVQVKVAEGPRYVCGEVKVIGTQKMPPAPIIARFTVAPAVSRSKSGAFAFKDEAPSSRALDESGPDFSSDTEAYWIKGEPVPASDYDLRRMKALVISAMHAHGFLHPQVNVSLAPDQTSRTAGLQVEVVEGVLGVVDRIEVSGNQTNSSEAVVRYLDVQPGTPITEELISRIEDKLWRSARFLEYKVSLGAPDATGQVPLQINVAEYLDASPLDQKLSPVGEAMLKMRDWLSKLGERREDIVLTVTEITNKVCDVEVILSPLNGLAVLEKNPSLQDKERVEYAAVLRPKLLGFYSVAAGRKLQLACPNTQLTAFLTMASKGPSTNAHPFDLSMGAGFKGQEDPEPYDSPYQFDLTLPPVTCVGLDHGWQFKDTFEGDLLIRSNASSILKIDSRAGRIIELCVTNDNLRVEAAFKRDAFTRALQRIEADTLNLPDLCDTNAVLSSSLSFLAEEVFSSRFLGSSLRTNTSSNAPAPLAAVLPQLKLATILLPLNQLVATTIIAGTNSGRFWVPEETPSGGQGFLVLMAGWLLRQSDQLAAPGSWPWSLLREAALVVQGRGRYTDQTLAQIYTSNETGPLCFYVTAALLERVDSPQARKFAARGLERLSVEDFRRDCRVLLSGQSIFSQCFQKLAAAVPDLKEEQLASLSRSPALAAFLRDCVRRLRDAKGQAAFDAMAPALDAYWQAEFKDVVASALRRQAIDPVAAYEEAVKLYESEDTARDYAKAAGLFQQAAEVGHPGAQCYLAILYAKGQGVPKDLALALKWYQEAASNGSNRAAMALGDLFSDGIERPEDHVSAFVWYSVAASRGHKVAPMLRESQRHKLSATQVADAEKQVQEILGQKPAFKAK
jgi:TPR repeat protein